MREGEHEAAQASVRADDGTKPSAGGELLPDSDKNSPEDAESAVEGDLAALLDDVKRERDEYLDLARRAKADFENYRKRAAQQASDAERRAKTSLASSILPAVDNLERALDAAPEGDPLTDGVRLVLGELNGALTKAGVEPFDPSGEKFDPASSEALSSQPRDGAEPGTVVEVLQRGYRLGEHVIRPARVVVAE